ncbi:MAG: hypothetical protein BZ151_08935 [Desulfobacca sp. 4484_104]|nr:MAG: hypothetical protein BZ151_08935 [Desulfobacca sp. 4484_104]RLA89966.1 MAG: hypothetical protein DRG58_03580 [Deltaproteobacteria bacterium]
MAGCTFQATHKQVLREAVVIAEEVTSDFYKLSRNQWRQTPYDILTLEELRQPEISSHALALVAKYNCCRPGRVLKSAHFDLYRICLQDHNILRKLAQSEKFSLLPLLIYVVTHELVHVVRFGHFLQLFEVPETDKAKEEALVHHLTQQILAPLRMSQLDEVLQYYRRGEDQIKLSQGTHKSLTC